jgi:ATP-dependent Lhr-like helicase
VKSAALSAPGQGSAAQSGKRILFRDGVPMAAIISGKIGYLFEPGAERELLHAHLVVRHQPG